jgi:hypothetical protein
LLCCSESLITNGNCCFLKLSWEVLWASRRSGHHHW